MPYTYSTIAPTPAWITVDSLTGLVTVNKANAPVNGFTGIARFQVSDGAATAIQDVPINVYAKYTVTTEYKELLSHRWVAKASSRSKDSEAQTTVRWNAMARNQVKDVTPAVSTPGARLVQFQRQFQVVASLPPVNRLVQFERSIEPEAGTFSTVTAPLLGTAGLTSFGLFTSSISLPFAFGFGGAASTTSVYRFQNRLYIDAGFYTQWIEVNNRVSTNFIDWHGGGDANKYRIRWEAEDSPGGNPTIWEVTLFSEGVIQVATGTLGTNTGNNHITSPTTPIAFVDNTSFVINYLRSSFTNSYIVRQGSYTI
jgi:hypothetical protein